MTKMKHVWADPSREGRQKNKQDRFCSRCGNTVRQTRILKSLNLCEYCLQELSAKRDGVISCRGCGKVAPLELKEHQGYCTACICPACGRPDPVYRSKSGLCFQCASQVGDFCRRCGKEASAQVRKNKGLCDECAALKPARHSLKTSGPPAAKPVGPTGGRSRHPKNSSVPAHPFSKRTKS